MKTRAPTIAEVKTSPFFYGYVIIGAAFVIQAVVWGISNCFGLFFDSFIGEFGWSRAKISGVGSLCFLVHGLSSMLAGNLNDRFGPRLIMSGCGLFLGIGFLLTAKINSACQLYLVYGLIVGVGLGGVDVITLSTATRWFQKKRGMMTGIIKVGTGVGMVIMPFFITWLLKSSGWRTSFAVLAVIMVVFTLVLAQFLVRDPARKALFIDNNPENKSKTSNRGEDGLTVREAICTRQLWTVCTLYFIILFCVYTILLHIVQHAIDQGIPAAVAAGILATVGAVSITGRFLMGGAGDKIGEKTALLICLTFLLIALGWLLAVKSLWMFYLFAALYGFAHGGFFSLTSPLIARLFGTRSHGLLYGMVIFASTIGGAIGPFVAGYIFDVTHSYKIVFLILLVMCTIALALTASLKPILKREEVST